MKDRRLASRYNKVAQCFKCDLRIRHAGNARSLVRYLDLHIFYKKIVKILQLIFKRINCLFTALSLCEIGMLAGWRCQSTRQSCGSRVEFAAPRFGAQMRLMTSSRGDGAMAFVKKNPWIVMVVVFGALVAAGIAFS